MDCNNKACEKKIGKVSDWDTDLEVARCRRTKKKWLLPHENAPQATPEDIPADPTTHRIPLNRLDRELIARIKEEFGPNPEMGSPQGVVLVDPCVEMDGCYCKIAPDAQGALEEENRQYVYTREFEYVVEDRVRSPNWDEVPPIVRDLDGRPTTIDPIVHQLDMERDGNGNPVDPNIYIRRTRYHAAVEFAIRFDVWIYEGVCKPVRELLEEDNEDEEHGEEEEGGNYFVKRRG